MSVLEPSHVADFHRFETEWGEHVLLVNGSRVFTFPRRISDSWNTDPAVREHEITDYLDRNDYFMPIYIGDERPVEPAVRALSLAVAQKCNLGCTYCYAQEGDFGGASRNMSMETALQSVRRLFEHVQEGERVNLAFMGGEPLINRPVIRAATELADKIGKERNASVGFSITTNGTLVQEADADFFEQHGFAVTISLDGEGETNDRLRAFKSGQGSYHRIMQRIEPLLAKQRAMQVSARVTVTPRNLELKTTLDSFISYGFHTVGFSPMLSSPTGRDEMQKHELAVMLEQMIECGEAFEEAIVDGRRYAFSNMVTAMREIHRGTHRPYPCGAGAGYLGVGADGGLFACHRFVDDEKGRLGSLRNGIDRVSQNRWLANRHVHGQSPCKVCWARYLCGGGCHHEVIHRGRPACDYIRGWLDYTLRVYVRLLHRRPDYFAP